MDFFEGGAFPEIHVPQYPRGMRGLIASQWELIRNNKQSSASSGVARHQSVEGTLVVKHDAHIALKPSEEVIKAKAMETKAALEARLQATTAHVGNLSERSDPLDPRPLSLKSTSAATQSAAITVRHDPGPIVRSPTKKKLTADEAKLQEEMKSVPFCVSSWKNPKNIIVPLEQRLAQAHRQETPRMADTHLELASTLRETNRRLQRQQQLDEKTAQEAMENAVAQSLEDAQMLLPSLQPQEASSRETREERLESRRLEREHRERERDARAKLRRYEAAAKRLGITLDALMADGALRKSVDEAGSGHHDDVENLVDSRVVLEAQRLHHDAAGEPGDEHRPAVVLSSGTAVVSGDSDGLESRPDRVTSKGVAAEMRRLDELDSAKHHDQQPRVRTLTDHDDDDDDDGDDDLFGLRSMETNRKRARQDEN